MSQELTPAMLKAIDRVTKLLALAGNNPNKEESEAAAAKAQEILTAFNLDMAMVEKADGSTGKREEMHERGGFYKWQTELWSAVAELNFCKYFVQDYMAPNHSHLVKAGGKAMRKQKRHRIIGRTVNTLATKIMATYLEQAIERSVRENLSITRATQLSNMAQSFRKGCVDTLVTKISAKYHEKLREEKAKEREQQTRSKHPGAAPASTALVLSSYIKSEEDANADFMYGEGYSARAKARRAELEIRWAEEQRIEDEWAKANPIEAAAKEKAAEEELAKWATRQRSGPRDNTNYEAYSAGRKAADAIGLDPQVARTTTKRIS